LIALNDLLPQVFRGKIVDDAARETILNNIIKILANRHLNNDIQSWREFFAKFPVNDDYVFDNTLLKLVNKHKRAVQVSLYAYVFINIYINIFLIFRNQLPYQQSITPHSMIWFNQLYFLVVL
jgi:hypothetical protein